MAIHPHIQHRNRVMVKEYIEGSTIADLCRVYKLSRSSVCAVLTSVGWPERQGTRSIEERALRVLVTRGRWSEENIFAIGAKLGYNKGELRDLLTRIVKGEPDPVEPPPAVPVNVPEVPGERIIDEFGAYVDPAQSESDNEE